MIIATPQPNATPPRVDVTVSVPVGAVMQSVSLWRVAGGSRELVRTQPSAGFDSRTVNDYEAPYEASLIYEWQAQYVDEDAIVPVWSESWSSLAAWTTSGGSWSVSGGKLLWTGADSLTAFVNRNVTPGIYRFVIATPPVGIQTIDFGGFSIDVARRRLVVGTQTLTFEPGVGEWRVEMSSNSVSLVTSVGEYSLSAAVLMTQVRFVGPVTVLNAPVQNDLQPGAGEHFSQIAFTANGRMFVVEAISSRIRQYNPDGSYFGLLPTITFAGTSLRDVASDGTNVYSVVAGSGTGSFRGYTPSGGTYAITRSFTISPPYFAVGPSTAVGECVALQPEAGIVRREFVSGATAVTLVSAPGTGVGQIPPSAFSVAATANAVYVVDADKVQVFNPSTGAYVRRIPAGTGLGQVINPIKVVPGRDGEVFVLHKLTGARASYVAVSKFTSTGTFLWRITTRYPYEIWGNDFASLNDMGAGWNPFTNELVIRGQYVPITDLPVSGPVPYGISRFSETRPSVDAASVSEYGADVFVDESTDPVVLTPPSGWMVHPGKPSLSFPLAGPSDRFAGIRSVEPVENESTTALHRIMGQAQPVAVSSGPRAGDRYTLTVVTTTPDERRALAALLRDQTVLLLRIPPSWDVDMDDGFFSVGTTNAAREVQAPSDHHRVWALPLTSVRSPIVQPENATGWSYAAVAAEFSTYAELRAAFATYADLLTNTRAS